MTDEHVSYCRKEKEIAEMHTDLKNIKKIVMEGNGYEPLMTAVPKIANQLEKLNKETVPSLQKGMSGFMKFQEQIIGGRNQVKYLIGVIALLLTALGITIGLAI